MFTIEERLRLIREGTDTAPKPGDVDYDGMSDDVTLDFLGANFNNFTIESAFAELFMIEADSITTSMLESSYDNHLITELLYEATTEGASDDKKAGLWQKIKQGLKNLKDKFDPAAGLRELDAVREVINTEKDINKKTKWWGILGAFFAISAMNKHYAMMDTATKQKYLKQAKDFRDSINKDRDALAAKGDVKGAKKALNMIRRLDHYIETFKSTSAA